jgi:hypothetical protein
VAFLAGFVENDVYGIFQLLLPFPIKGFVILKLVGIQIMQTGTHFCTEVFETALWREMTLCATHSDPAFIAVMCRLYPGLVSTCVDVAGLTVRIGAGVLHHPVGTQYQGGSKDEPGDEQDPTPGSKLQFCMHSFNFEKEKKLLQGGFGITSGNRGHTFLIVW